MKKFTTFLILLTTTYLFSCGRSDEILPIAVFEVTTSGISVDCKLVIIEFAQSDRERLEKLTNRNGTIFEAYNLDAISFNTVGEKLRVTIRKPLDSELFPCTRLGPTFPWVTVIHSEIID
jgi:hypothetical protein